MRVKQYNILRCKYFFVLKKDKGEEVKKVGEVCNLSELKRLQKCKVLKINEHNKVIKKHLLDMGITRGVVITIKKMAPLGDPIDINLRDYELCMRKSNLAKILVEVIE